MGCRTAVPRVALHAGDISVPSLFSLNIALPLADPGVSRFCLKTCTWPQFHLLQHTKMPVRSLTFIKLLPKCCYMKPLLKIKINNVFSTYCCLPVGETEAKDARGTSLKPVKSLANVSQPHSNRPAPCLLWYFIQVFYQVIFFFQSIRDGLYFFQRIIEINIHKVGNCPGDISKLGPKIQSPQQPALGQNSWQHNSPPSPTPRLCQPFLIPITTWALS